MSRYIFLFMAFPLLAFGQNYVPNPSFEYHIGCPNNNYAPQVQPDEMAKASPWESYNGSPDYFNPCVNNPNMWCDAPNTGAGYQMAYDGESFAGFLFSRTDYLDNNQTFEVLGCPLTAPLTIGNRYLVSMRFSLSDVVLNASNHIGALFLMREYDTFNGPITFPDKCHVCTDSVNVDFTNWTEVSGIFEADSAYTHIAIGHFLDSTSFAILPGAPGQGAPGAPYYFVDYICVVPEGGDCSIPLSASQPHQAVGFMAYPNPLIKSQSSILHFSKESDVEVYNLVGQMVGRHERVMEIDAISWPGGVYWLKDENGAMAKMIVME